MYVYIYIYIIFTDIFMKYKTKAPFSYNNFSYNKLNVEWK